jgi:uncharacterized protein YbbK (DUF523 family)
MEHVKARQACLRDKRCDDDILQRWLREGRVVPICPEVAGGLPVPRPPAEIAGGAGGRKVLEGLARVVDGNGKDVSVHFVDGAKRALQVASSRGAGCDPRAAFSGSSYSYDGSFTGTRFPSWRHGGASGASGVAVLTKPNWPGRCTVAASGSRHCADQVPATLRLVIIQPVAYLSRRADLCGENSSRSGPTSRPLGPWLPKRSSTT